MTDPTPVAESTTSAEATPAPAPVKSKVLPRFVAFAFAAMIVLTLIWTKVTPWTSYPIAVLSHMAMDKVAPMWVRDVHKQPG